MHAGGGQETGNLFGVALLIKCHSSQTNSLAESTENWCVDGLINIEEPFSELNSELYCENQLPALSMRSIVQSP